MAEFTALFPAVTSGDELSFTVHAAGCRDIKREADKRSASTFTFSAESVTDALDVIIDEELIEMGYSHRDVKVHNCCRKGV